MAGIPGQRRPDLRDCPGSRPGALGEGDVLVPPRLPPLSEDQPKVWP